VALVSAIHLNLTSNMNKSLGGCGSKKITYIVNADRYKMIMHVNVQN